jgi:hypothetical protein
VQRRALYVWWECSGSCNPRHCYNFGGAARLQRRAAGAVLAMPTRMHHTYESENDDSERGQLPIIEEMSLALCEAKDDSDAR